MKGILLDYEGIVDQERINFLLDELKTCEHFRNLHKITAKRVYSVTVECLENIIKYSIGSDETFAPKPFISIEIKEDKIVVRSGNTVYENIAEGIAKKLNKINCISGKDLLDIYERKLNRESVPEENGAGLGFIIMKMKSGNNLDYSFTNIRNGFSYFNLQVSVNNLS